jgi:hypothetical protein
LVLPVRPRSTRGKCIREILGLPREAGKGCIALAISLGAVLPAFVHGRAALGLDAARGLEKLVRP